MLDTSRTRVLAVPGSGRYVSADIAHVIKSTIDRMAGY